jgi:hypothetical protein
VAVDPGRVVRDLDQAHFRPQVEPAGPALARRRDDLRHAVGLADGAPEGFLDGPALVVEDGLGVGEGGDHPQVAAPRPQRALRQLVERRGVAPQIGDLVPFDGVQVVRDEVGGEVIGGQIELVQGGVPDPERGAAMRDRRHQLAAQDGPAIPA